MEKKPKQKIDWLKAKRSKRSFFADRRTVSAKQAYEVYYIQQTYGVGGDDPKTKCTTKKIRSVIKEMIEARANHHNKTIFRVELMKELDKRGLLYHDPA